MDGDLCTRRESATRGRVASLGTAFTPEQARLLKKYAGKAVLCYDADQAAHKAAIRAGAF